MKIALITSDDVVSVYSGVDGKCCCGCAGKHTVNSKYVTEASKSRGYKVCDDEVSDRTVGLILNKMKKQAADVEDGKTYLSLVVGKRLYVAYLTAKAIKRLK